MKQIGNAIPGSLFGINTLFLKEKNKLFIKSLYRLSFS